MACLSMPRLVRCLTFGTRLACRFDLLHGIYYGAQGDPLHEAGRSAREQQKLSRASFYIVFDIPREAVKHRKYFGRCTPYRKDFGVRREIGCRISVILL